MHYTYKTKGTCSTQIDLDLEGNVLKHVTFTNGCNGNLKIWFQSNRTQKRTDSGGRVQGLKTKYTK